MQVSRRDFFKKLLGLENKKTDRNPNRPKKGDIIKVSPIRSKEHIEAIKNLLESNPRDLAIFTIGINSALRASDILRITLGNVEGLKVGESFSIREKKTQKIRRVVLNEASHAAIQKYLKVRRPTRPDVPLFLSRIGKNRSITVSYLNNLVKRWGRKVGIKDNLGSHTLRKTWAYQNRQAGVPMPILMVALNHSSQFQTLAYLGIEQEELTDAFLNVI